MGSLSSTELPPEIARQIAISNYVLVGSTSVLIWDVLSHLFDDYTLVSKHRFTFPSAAYFTSRICNMVFLLGSCVIGTALVDNCHGVQLTFNAFYALGVPSSQLLFFLPVRAIWKNHPKVVWIFNLLWLATAGSAFSPLIGFSVTSDCASGSFSAYTTVAAIVPCVTDSLLFIALVWQTLQTTLEGENIGIWEWIKGPTSSSIPHLAKILLLNGRAYYLCTIGTGLASIVMSYITSLPIPYRTILGFPAVALMNIMACRIYRNTKFGRFRTEVSTTFVTPELPTHMVFAAAGTRSTVMSRDSIGRDTASDAEPRVHVLSLNQPPSVEKFDSASHSSV